MDFWEKGHSFCTLPARGQASSVDGFELARHQGAYLLSHSRPAGMRWTCIVSAGPLVAHTDSGMLDSSRLSSQPRAGEAGREEHAERPRASAATANDTSPDAAASGWTCLAWSVTSSSMLEAPGRRANLTIGRRLPDKSLPRMPSDCTRSPRPAGAHSFYPVTGRRRHRFQSKREE